MTEHPTNLSMASPGGLHGSLPYRFSKSEIKMRSSAHSLCSTVVTNCHR